MRCKEIIQKSFYLICVPIIQVLTFFADVTVTPTPAADILASSHAPPIRLHHETTMTRRPERSMAAVLEDFENIEDEIGTAGLCNLPESSGTKTNTVSVKGATAVQRDSVEAALKQMLGLPTDAPLPKVAAPVNDVASVKLADAQPRDSVEASLKQLLGLPFEAALPKAVTSQQPPKAPFKALVIVMELCESGTLNDAIRDGAFRKGPGDPGVFSLG